MTLEEILKLLKTAESVEIINGHSEEIAEIVIQHFLFPNYCNSTAHYFRLFSHHGLSNVHFFAAHYFLILLVDIFNVTKKRERTSPTTASSFSHTQVLQAVPKQDRVLNNTAICLQAVTYINYDKKKLTIYQAF